MDSPEDKFQLFFQPRSGSEVLLAEKPVVKGSEDEAPANRSRFYMRVAGQEGGIDWLSGHLGLGCLPAESGLPMHPRVFLGVGENSRLSFFRRPSGISRSPLSYSSNFREEFNQRGVLINIDGKDALGVYLIREDTSRIVMRVLQDREHPDILGIAFVRLLVGPRGFNPPENVGAAPWYVLRYNGAR